MIVGNLTSLYEITILKKSTPINVLIWSSQWSPSMLTVILDFHLYSCSPLLNGNENMTYNLMNTFVMVDIYPHQGVIILGTQPPSMTGPYSWPETYWSCYFRRHISGSFVTFLLHSWEFLGEGITWTPQAVARDNWWSSNNPTVSGVTLYQEWSLSCSLFSPFHWIIKRLWCDLDWPANEVLGNIIFYHYWIAFIFALLTSWDVLERYPHLVRPVTVETVNARIFMLWSQNP